MESKVMPLARMGSSALHLSRIGLGTWAMGGPWERGWGAQDDEASVAAIRRAIEGGVNWVDTAPVYGLGHAEEVVGRVIADYDEADRPLVLTKCGRRSTSDGLRSIGDPAGILQEAESSLRRLRVERIDVLQLHWPPADGTPIEETWAAMASLRERGTVRYIGACNVSTEQLERIESVAHVDLIQPPLSLINRGALTDALPWAIASGTGAIVYSPMQSGILTETFDRERVDRMAPDDWRRANPEFSEPRLGRNLTLVETLRGLSAGLGCTVSELAIAWTLEQEGVTAAIVGARNPEQVDGWIRAADVVIDEARRAAIARALVVLDTA
jgi:aryl-alcohol dehydrogenase-like predicted oxidoreductase